MTIALAGEGNSSLGGGSLVYTPAVGNYLAVVAIAQTSDVTALSDGVNTYTKQGASLSGGTGWFMTLWTSAVIAASAAYTITPTSAGTQKSVWVGEISGSSGYQTSTGNPQATFPGTGTDAVTSGLLGTLSAQPALVYGVCLTLGSAVPSTAGTNFTIATASGWSAFGASEKQRVTALTSIAATFTNTAGASDHFLTGAFVFTESPASGLLLMSANSC
jgi:hypothetical protein